MARVRLTKTLVDDLQTPEKGQVFVWDSEVPGFAVRTTPSGAKAWIVQMRVRGGKERRMTIGFCHKVPLDKARQEARKVLATADLGRDPAQERKEAREVKPDMNPTFAEFSTRWLAEVAERRNRAGTLKNRRLLLKNHVLPSLGEKPLADIGRKDIEDMCAGRSKAPPLAGLKRHL
ncbi:MAG: integrase arm-type DNA-binding domain-containing protein, partial [Rhodospirillaceae bacterium]